MTEEYCNAQYCLKGHAIVTNMSQPELKSDHCTQCGCETILCCPDCQAPIRGDKYIVKTGICDIEFTSYEVQPRPDFCHNCGQPYPWAKMAMDTMNDTLLELDDLNPEEVDRVRELIPDIIVDTPKTTLAIVRLQKLFNSSKDYVRAIIVNLLVSFGCDTIKMFFGL